MANRLVKLVDYEYLPAIRGVTPRPAYCTTVQRTRAITTYVSTNQQGIVGWTTTSTSDPLNPSSNLGYNPTQMVPIYGTTQVRTPVTQYRTVVETVCFPEVVGVEGREAQLTYRGVEGWDAGARSVGSFVGDFYLEFDFNPDGSGMLCGLAPTAAQVAEYNAIRHGLGLIEGVLYVVESGIVVANLPYEHGARVAIRRAGGVVTYQSGVWDYESQQPSEGVVSVNACLYVSGDYIDNPLVASIHQLSARSVWEWVGHDTAFALSAYAGWGWLARATLGDGFARVSASAVISASQDDYGSAWVDLEGVGIQANDTPVIAVSGITLQMPVVAVGNGSKVSVGDANVDGGGAVISASDYMYGGASLDVVSIHLFGLEIREPQGYGTTAEALVSYDEYTTDPVVWARLDSTLTIGSSIDVLVALDAALVDYLVHSDDVSATMVMSALLASNLKFSDNIGAVRAAVLQYTTNLLTGGVGRYEGFDFSGFVRVGMDTYGWKHDGLYRLGYAEDTGEQISAMIEFAAEDFDTTTRKTLRALFFGADTDGAMYARLVDDNDCDATYRVVPHGDTHRANPAQRPSSRFWRLRLEIVDATVADIDSIEWKAATTGRRTRS